MGETTQSRFKERPPGRFEDLVAMMPPRAIQDEVHYGKTIEMLDRLTSLPRMTKGQKQYLETLSVLVDAYEREHHAIPVDQSPVRVLQHLMAEHELNASELGELLGNRSLGSKILRRERALSKTHIRLLAARFNVSPAAFF